MSFRKYCLCIFSILYIVRDAFVNETIVLYFNDLIPAKQNSNHFLYYAFVNDTVVFHNNNGDLCSALTKINTMRFTVGIYK